MLRSLFIFILFITLRTNASAEESCFTIEPSVAKSNLQDLAKISKAMTPSIEFCWMNQACTNFSAGKPLGLEIPQDSICLMKTHYVESTKKCGLTYQERLALETYTRASYGCLNSYLRQNKIKSPALEEYIKTLNRGLDKLPSYEGLVIRGADLPEEIRSLHQKGSVVTYSGFTSTSTFIGFGGKDNFIIISKTGKPIMSFSQYIAEAEVLFKSGTKFKILDRYEMNDKNFIVMKEIVNEKISIKEIEDDLALVEKMKNMKERELNFDEWSCSEGEDPPEKIEQKIYPVYDT